jgi:hypothetical protein
MSDNNPPGKMPEGAAGEPEKPAQPAKVKKEKVPVDPAQRGSGGFNRSQLKGKSPVFRKTKKSGR